MTGATTPYDADLAREKSRVRTRVLACRDAIPAEERARRSRVLCDRLVAALAPVLGPGSLVAAYSALGSEPDLAPFLREACAREWRVCLPCMLRASLGAADAPHAAPFFPMVFVEVDRPARDACEAPFIVEPARSVPPDHPSLACAHIIEPDRLDAVVVPLVAFDADNNRLGYGGGNYDRCLGRLRDDAVVLGAAFAEQRVDAVPLEAHDLPLPRIETA